MYFVMQSFFDHLETEHSTNNNIICYECNETVDLDDFEQHLMEHSLGFYQCIFCRFGCDAETTMREHLAENHPNELSVVCIRKAKEQRLENEMVSSINQSL